MNEITVIDTNALAQITGGYKLSEMIGNIKADRPWTGATNVNEVRPRFLCKEEVAAK